MVSIEIFDLKYYENIIIPSLIKIIRSSIAYIVNFFRNVILDLDVLGWLLVFNSV